MIRCFSYLYLYLLNLVISIAAPLIAADKKPVQVETDWCRVDLPNTRSFVWLGSSSYLLFPQVRFDGDSIRDHTMTALWGFADKELV